MHIPHSDVIINIKYNAILTSPVFGEATFLVVFVSFESTCVVCSFWSTVSVVFSLSVVLSVFSSLSILFVFSFTVNVYESLNSPLIAVIIVVPAFKAFTFPFSSTVAIASSLDDHSTFLISVVFSGVYTISNLFSSPSSKVSFLLLIAIPSSLISFTVTAHLASNSPTVAIIFTVPSFNAFTFPVLSTVTILVSSLLQVTVLSSVVSSGVYTTFSISVWFLTKVVDVFTDIPVNGTFTFTLQVAV